MRQRKIVMGVLLAVVIAIGVWQYPALEDFRTLYENARDDNETSEAYLTRINETISQLASETGT
jgi:hypothetical protein